MKFPSASNFAMKIFDSGLRAQNHRLIAVNIKNDALAIPAQHNHILIGIPPVTTSAVASPVSELLHPLQFPVQIVLDQISVALTDGGGGQRRAVKAGKSRRKSPTHRWIRPGQRPRCCQLYYHRRQRKPYKIPLAIDIVTDHEGYHRCRCHCPKYWLPSRSDPSDPHPLRPKCSGSPRESTEMDFA